MKKPNFFIIGAPKCGTTAMYEYLKAHPNIFLPKKELHFFGLDLNLKFRIKTVKQYLALFAKAKEKNIGDASVWYLYSKLAAKEIKQFNPEVKIIIMIRNPIEMIYANYYQFLYNGNENLNSFREALAAEKIRKKGRKIPPTAHFVSGLFYLETAKYSEQIKRYAKIFSKKNIHIIIYDDFKKNPKKEYIKTLDFLRVSTLFLPDIKVINANKITLNKKLNDLLIAPPKILSFSSKFILPRFLRGKTTALVKKLNTKYIERPPISKECKKYLQKNLKEEISSLSILLNNDLAYWLE